MSVFFIALLFSGSVAAQDAPATETSAKPEKKICKYENASESRLGGRRICRTAEEWRALADRTGKQLERRDQ